MRSKLLPLLCALALAGLVPAAPHSRAAENLDRALAALPAGKPGSTFLTWRSLSSDSPTAAFHVYAGAPGRGQRLSAQPVAGATSVEVPVPFSVSNQFYVQLVGDKAGYPAGRLPARQDPGGLPYLSLRLKGDYPASKVGLADLDGDGAYDFIIKQPQQVTDPGVWRKSDDTFKIEAYRSDGTFLWSKDLGWNIEQGIWYSPMVVFDFDGDGRAEIAAKTAPLGPDFRNATGRVLDGPEYCSILDGQTGREVDRVDWPARGNIAAWGDAVGNRASRHMLGIAYLDGKTPSLLVHRGTYTTMILEAYNFSGGKLRKLWSWNGDRENPPVRGQGLHGIQAADIDDDGRQEVILGSAAIDDDGKLLWSTRLGHADACYVTDIDPKRPGLEIMYGIEPPQRSNGVCLVEARTGKILWGYPVPTSHVHSQGMLADLTSENPGMEFYTGEKQLRDRWLFGALTGNILSTEDLGGLAPVAVYWADGPLKPFVSRDSLRYYQGAVLGTLEGRPLAVADVVGDWREEIIASIPGEVRIYTSNIPSRQKRACLMQDRHYRVQVGTQMSGYFYPPQPLQPF